jgi:inorganic triphosphatase YgiF
LESEIKLRLDGATQLSSILENPLIARLAMPDSRREPDLVNLYYDTAQHDLTGRQMTLRLRQDGRLTTITLKSGEIEASELQQRFEWTAVLPPDWDGDLRNGLDTGWFRREATSMGDPDAALTDALALIKSHPLVVLCEARFHRTTLDIGYGDSLLELAVDRGELIAGERNEELYEIEVELKEGDVRDLVELGHEMQNSLPVTPEPLSKFARCLRLLQKQKA